MQLPVRLCETKNSWCSWHDSYLGAACGGWRWCWSEHFRHCHPAWAADFEPCRPQSVNLWRTGFLAPLTQPCHEAPCSVPRGRAAPPPESPALPSYEACICNRDKWIWIVSHIFAILQIYWVWLPSRDLKSNNIKPLKWHHVLLGPVSSCSYFKLLP